MRLTSPRAQHPDGLSSWIPNSARLRSNLQCATASRAFAGSAYPAETLLELLSSGMTTEEILADYDDLNATTFWPSWRSRGWPGPAACNAVGAMKFLVDAQLPGRMITWLTAAAVQRESTRYDLRGREPARRDEHGKRCGPTGINGQVIIEGRGLCGLTRPRPGGPARSSLLISTAWNDQQPGSWRPSWCRLSRLSFAKFEIPLVFSTLGQIPGLSVRE